MTFALAKWIVEELDSAAEPTISGVSFLPTRTS